jgi:guanylate kinase
MIKALLPRWPALRFSISCTTRAPRAGEVSGKDYYFLDREEFAEGIREGRFIEWARVHGEYYGTDGRRVGEWLEAGEDVLLDIDVQGASRVRCVYPRAITAFIVPPSMEILRKRLEARGTESPEKLASRLSAAWSELRVAPWYDFIIVNEILEDAVADLDAIIRASRRRRETGECPEVIREAFLNADRGL